MGVIRRLLVVAALATAVAGAGVAIAGGQTTTLTGTAEWPTLPPDWTSQTTTIHGTFSGSFGVGTYEGTLTGVRTETTAECGPVCLSESGTITLSSQRGDLTLVVMPGSTDALDDTASTSLQTFELDVRVFRGPPTSLRLVAANVDWKLHLSYVSTWRHYFDSNTGEYVNTITDSGTLARTPR